MRSQPASWGPIVEDGKRFVTDRVAKLVSRRLRLPFHVVAEMLLALDNRHRYLLLEPIAETRRAAVFAGVDRLLAREVAIKIHRDADEHANRRAVLEARAMSGVEHPNIVQIYDLGEVDGWLYAVTELCETDLSQWCVGRSWSEILDRIVEVGAGLVHLHGSGYVHGDVKPANILIKKGTAKLADFGLAARPGHSFALAGTPGFIAPEAALGERGLACDVFGLSVTAWACLFGRLPFGQPPEDADVERSILFTIERLTRGEIERPGRLPRGMPKLVLEVLERGFDPDPKRRPSLEAWLAELRVAAEVVRPLTLLRRALPTAAVIGLLGVAGFAFHIARPAQPETVARPWIMHPMVSPALMRQQAEAAAEAGDGALAVDAIHRAYLNYESLTRFEQKQLARTADRVGWSLTRKGLTDEAKIAWSYSALLFRYSQRPREAARAKSGVYAATSASLQ